MTVEDLWLLQECLLVGLSPHELLHLNTIVHLLHCEYRQIADHLVRMVWQMHTLADRKSVV